MFASDLIRRKLAEVREKQIPVVVSMGTVAASGGYWIAAEADEIWALPTTLTGSIGAFSAFPTIEGIVEYIGVTVDGVGTSPLAGAASFNRGLSPEMASIVQALSYGAYDDFIELVANGRGMTDAEVRKIAEGIVWTGADAVEIGLVTSSGAYKRRLLQRRLWRVSRSGERDGRGYPRRLRAYCFRSSVAPLASRQCLGAVGSSS